MSNVTVCVRFRPPTPKEKEAGGVNNLCVQGLDSESFMFKAGKKEELAFCFDRVFYQDSAQADVYEFLAMPVVRDAINGINGAIITYGQTGAGKTYSMEGPSISECDAETKGLIPRVVDEIFEHIKAVEDTAKFTVKISMVEIYMEKVRDLFDVSKDNLQIKETRTRGIFLSGVTEVTILDPEEALKCLSRGIASRAVGETRIFRLIDVALTSESCQIHGHLIPGHRIHADLNMGRNECGKQQKSLCIYLLGLPGIIQKREGSIRRTAKLVLVDLAGSEKVEKTGAEGRILDEARTINKSLSALGNVINALTTGKVNHIPYRDSKLTRIMQDALGGNSRTALLCCCSPSTLNTSESLSTLRFGTRTKLIKTPLHTHVQTTETAVSPDHDSSSRQRVLAEPRKSPKPGEVDLPEERCRSEESLLDLDRSDEENKSEGEAAVGETTSSPEEKTMGITDHALEESISEGGDVASETTLSSDETVEMVKRVLEEVIATYRALEAEREAEQLLRTRVVPGQLSNFSGKALLLFRWLRSIW